LSEGKGKYFSQILQENFEIYFVMSIFVAWITRK
jgi:hypothetical protein